MEVTFDPSTGGSFESRNGAPINETEPQPLATEEIPLDSEGYEQLGSDYEIEEDQEEELKPFNFNPNQQSAVNKLKQELNLDAEEALRWANTPDCEITDGGHQRLVEMMKSDDPETVSIGMGLISLAKANPDFFNHDSEDIAENFSDEQQYALVDLLGGGLASAIVNHTFMLSTGQLTKADVIKQCASNPELRDAYIKAATKGLLTFNL